MQIKILAEKLRDFKGKKVIAKKSSKGKTFLIVDGGMHQNLSASGNLGQVIRRNYKIKKRYTYEGLPTGFYLYSRQFKPCINGHNDVTALQLTILYGKRVPSPDSLVMLLQDV